jgi:SAM-dependent methyltransferase
MLAPNQLPAAYVAWNRRHNAPWGRRGKRLIDTFGPRVKPVARYLGPYAWQPNNSLRTFEYPWAFERLGELGSALSVVDVGAGLAGFQFTLAQSGHEVHAVDPGLSARGKGWELDAEQHAFLADAYRAPVHLHPTTLGDAGLADGSMDALVSISTIEHFASDDLDELADQAARVLRPGGHLVLTIDLFLDVHPFTSRRQNDYGTNIDVRALLERCGATLVAGDPAELYGYQEFDPDRIQSHLSGYLVGATYPGLTQCLVARVGTNGSR